MSVIRLAQAAPTAPYDGAEVGAIFDSVLVGARAGADWAWTLLYRSLAPRVLIYLRANGIATAEAAVGDVFAQAAADLSDFHGDERAFATWVFTKAHALVVEERVQHDGLAIFSGHPVAPEARLAADVLDPEQRDVVLLAVCGHLSPVEIAGVVDRPIWAVKALERKAYGQLRTRLISEGL